MIKNSIRYELDATQLDQALAILRKQQQANMPSRWQKISYVLLSIWVYGFVASLFLAIIALFMAGTRNSVLFYPLVSVGILVMLTPIILLLNIPLLRKLRHQIRLVCSLGLWQFFKVPWRAERRKRRCRNILVLVVVCLGLCLTVFGILGSIISLTEVLHTGFSWRVVRDILYFLLFIIICLALIFFYLMRRYKQRLEVVARLQSSFAGYKDAAEQDEGTRINIPQEEYEQIAQIERAQISFEREMNILASFEESDVAYYSVQKSRSVREALRQLDLATRLAVEDQIDELEIEPRPSGATSDPKTNIHRLRVSETPIEITFTLDYDNRRVKILSLQSVPDDATSHSEPGG